VATPNVIDEPLTDILPPEVPLPAVKLNCPELPFIRTLF
jgi:hypothetical protein